MNRVAGRPKESSVKFAGRGRLTLRFRRIEVGPMGLFFLGLRIVKYYMHADFVKL
jgi:hypothetical protein